MEAAVALSAGSLADLLGKLESLASQCSRITGVGKQIEFLHKELNAMHSMLLKVASMEEQEDVSVDVQLKTWAREVRETAYDVEDCVDAFTISVRLASAGGGEQAQGVRGKFKNYFRKFAGFLLKLRVYYNFASRIKELSARVVEVGERRERYRVDDVASVHSGSPSFDLHLHALFAKEDDLVGIDGPRDSLVSWLESRGQGLAVLAIVGLGGLGKTTLAKRIYDTITHQEPCSSAFVSVSQRPDMNNVLQQIALQLLPELGEEVRSWDVLYILTRIKNEFLNKRFIIVVDDLWSVEAWEILNIAFTKNTCSSRIIVTTRNVEVARSCVRLGCGLIHYMEALNKDQSRNLFIKRCEILFEDVADDILCRCGGLPLAVICIAGVLANKPAVKQEWVKVRDSITSQLEERLNVILRLSYKELSPPLKRCLLYLSVYPEDYTIRRDRLVNKWIAEGFIHEEQDLSVQDIGQSYFDELMNRSLIQPREFGFDGKATACQIHDLLLDLIVSMSEEENFVTIVGQSAGSISSRQFHIRRLSVQNAGPENKLSLSGIDLSHVRSMTVFGSLKDLPPPACFCALKVLDFDRCTDAERYCWDSIEMLHHVKFLSFRNSVLNVLPPGVTQLIELRVLDLRGTGISQLPGTIVHLTKLERLLIGEFSHGKTQIPELIGNMKHLEVLSFFDAIHSDVVAVENLGLLKKLKKLSIQFDGGAGDKRHEEVLVSALGILGSLKLQSLWIASTTSTPLEFLNAWSPLPLSLQRFRMTSNYYFLGIPSWISPALTNLAYLNINLAEVNESHLEILGSLQALISLELWFKTEARSRLVLRGGGRFKFLKRFVYICGPLRGAGYIIFESGAVERLEYLEVPFFVSVAKNYGFNMGINQLPCLKAAIVTLCIQDAANNDVRSAEAAIMTEAALHQGHPRVTTILG